MHTTLSVPHPVINAASLPRIATARHVLDLQRAALGDLHPATLSAMGRLADALRGAGCKEMASEGTCLAVQAEESWRLLGAGRISRSVRRASEQPAWGKPHHSAVCESRQRRFQWLEAQLFCLLMFPSWSFQ